MKIQMIYDKTLRTSPFGKCWKPHLSKPTKRFDHNAYSIILSIDRMEVEYDQFCKVLDDFAKTASEEWGGVKVENKVIYISDKGNASACFVVKDKGQGAVSCFNDDGDTTEPPIDGDEVEVQYHLGAWMTEDGRAGIKVYLDSVVVLNRTGKPKTEKPFVEDDEDDGGWNYDDT